MSLADLSFQSMAFGLAEKARGWASPNPYVGAVIVRNSIIVGSGYHEKPGRPHAEAVALQAAGRRALNSTLYVTLEPCAHWGRTPPCVDSLLGAGFKRIVVSSVDPNPLVNGRGIQKLRQAGIRVEVGLLDEKNRSLNEAYIKFIQHKVPFVTVKAAVSLDGKIATASSDSQWISSEATRRHMHLLRGEQDGIMVGINTLLEDDPLLTVRHPAWPDKRLTRIIVDSRLRFPLKARMLDTLSAGKIIVFSGRNASRDKAAALRKKGVEVVSLPAADGSVDLQAVLSHLGGESLSGILVEGGSRLMTSLIERRLVDKLILSISPRMIGGERSPSLLGGRGVDRVGEAIGLSRIRALRIENDIIVEGYF